MYPADKSKTKYGLKYGVIYPNTAYFRECELAGKAHKGVDILPVVAEPVVIVAPVKGKVVFAGYHKQFGNLIAILFSGTHLHLLAHLKNFIVKTNQLVEKGQPIGVMGTTGYSTGVHLHYQVEKADTEGTLSHYWYKGTWTVIDPMPYCT